MPSEGLLVS